MQCILFTERASACAALSKSDQATTESVFLFHGIARVKECMADGRLFTRMQWNTGCCITAALQVVGRAWSALPKSIELGALQTEYSRYSLYTERMKVLQVVNSQKKDFSSLSRGWSLDDGRGHVSSEEGVHKAEWSAQLLQASPCVWGR